MDNEKKHETTNEWSVTMPKAPCPHCTVRPVLRLEKSPENCINARLISLTGYFWLIYVCPGKESFRKTHRISVEWPAWPAHHFFRQG
jgi:hypothetical protein